LLQCHSVQLSVITIPSAQFKSSLLSQSHIYGLVWWVSEARAGRPSTDDAFSCDLCFSNVLPAVEKLILTKLVPITAGIPQTETPSPRYYRGIIPIPVGLPQQMSPLPRELPR